MTNYNSNNPFSGDNPPQGGDGQNPYNQGLGDQGYSQPTEGSNAAGQGFEAFPNAQHHNNLGLQQTGHEYPGAGSRFLAFLLDSIVSGLLSFIVVWVIFHSQFQDFMSGETRQIPMSVKFGGAVIGVIVWYAYRVTMEAKVGGSLGRMATGTRVVKPTGEPVDFATAAKRNIFYPIATIINLIPILGPWLQIVFYIVIGVSISKSPTKQSFTDKPAPALVVKK